MPGAGFFFFIISVLCQVPQANVQMCRKWTLLLETKRCKSYFILTNFFRYAISRSIFCFENVKWLILEIFLVILGFSWFQVTFYPYQDQWQTAKESPLIFRINFLGGSILIALPSRFLLNHQILPTLKFHLKAGEGIPDMAP